LTFGSEEMGFGIRVMLSGQIGFCMAKSPANHYGMGTIQFAECQKVLEGAEGMPLLYTRFTGKAD